MVGRWGTSLNCASGVCIGSNSQHICDAGSRGGDEREGREGVGVADGVGGEVGCERRSPVYDSINEELVVIEVLVAIVCAVGIGL